MRNAKSFGKIYLQKKKKTGGEKMETIIAYAVALPILGIIIRSAFDLLEDILNIIFNK